MVLKKIQSIKLKRRRHQRRGWDDDSLNLSDLQSGDHARVMEIGGSEQFRIRLMEMGLLVGDHLEVDKYAPMQDPMEIIVKGYHLSLRVEDAGKISVEKVGN